MVARYFQSNIQENKDWNLIPFHHLFSLLSPFRATSKRTRIETRLSACRWHARGKLSEQHPREQGLKHDGEISHRLALELSEQHPREQGLKLNVIRSFSAVSPTLSEQHPREQGLKRHRENIALVEPEAFRATSKRTRIETLTLTEYWWRRYTFRATSKRTRIETPPPVYPLSPVHGLSEQHPREQGLKHEDYAEEQLFKYLFQSNIQENKDWNFEVNCLCSVYFRFFQSNIQENKDWNRLRALF